MCVFDEDVVVEEFLCDLVFGFFCRVDVDVGL